MVSFECDYNNGVHPLILKRLTESNDIRTSGYGTDPFTEQAKVKIKEACELPQAEVFLLAGGTQTNATVIDSLLRSYQGVIAATTAHICVHEAGAIETAGHKILTLPEYGGKIKAADLAHYMEVFMADDTNDHMVQPGLVYITFPTEFGMLYSKQELADIYNTCQKYKLPLYIDGARLGYGLMANVSDVTLPFLARHCDAFYIGGTKVGAYCGEAVVFTQKAPAHFFTMQKQHGAVTAKGRLLGIQFETLFTDNLYFRISKHAIEMAMRLKEMFLSKGYQLAVDSPTNQQFVLLSRAEYEQLSKQVLFEIWEKKNENELVCRFVTSWGTTDDEIAYLDEILNERSATFLERKPD